MRKKKELLNRKVESIIGGEKKKTIRQLLVDFTSRFRQGKPHLLLRMYDFIESLSNLAMGFWVVAILLVFMIFLKILTKSQIDASPNVLQYVKEVRQQVSLIAVTGCCFLYSWIYNTAWCKYEKKFQGRIRQ